jgi:hypothetical protein
VAVRSGERWRVMSNFVYGNSFVSVVDSGASGGAWGSPMEQEKIDRMLQELRNERERERKGVAEITVNTYIVERFTK